MENIKNLRERLDHMTQEIIQMKKIIMKLEAGDKKKREEAWKDLMSVSKEISKKWKGPSVVEEIKNQREKRW